MPGPVLLPHVYPNPRQLPSTPPAHRAEKLLALMPLVVLSNLPRDPLVAAMLLPPVVSRPYDIYKLLLANPALYSPLAVGTGEVDL